MNPDIFTKAFRTTYSVISGNVTDPLSRDAKWIWAANPMLGSETSPKLQYPIIIIEPFVTQDGNHMTMGDKYHNSVIGTTIEVHDTSASGRFDNTCGSLYDALVDNVHEFAKSGLRLEDFTGGIYENIPISPTNRIHIKSFGVSFNV